MMASLLKYTLILFCISALIWSCDNPTSSRPKIVNVEYSVTGSASSAFLTYQNKDGGTSQISDATLPWTLTFSGYEKDFVYLSAQNNNNSGSVTVTIYRNNAQFKTATSTGAYVIATASGTL